MITMIISTVVIKVAFIIGAVYLLMNGHPVAGAWMVVGALLCGYSSSTSKDED